MKTSLFKQPSKQARCARSHKKPVSARGNPRIILDPDYSIAVLVAAVIMQAQEDARYGDSSALKWLYDEGISWAEAIGIHPDPFRKWLDRTLGSVQMIEKPAWLQSSPASIGDRIGAK